MAGALIIGTGAIAGGVVGAILKHAYNGREGEWRTWAGFKRVSTISARYALNIVGSAYCAVFAMKTNPIEAQNNVYLYNSVVGTGALLSSYIFFSLVVARVHDDSDRRAMSFQRRAIYDVISLCSGVAAIDVIGLGYFFWR